MEDLENKEEQNNLVEQEITIKEKYNTLLNPTYKSYKLIKNRDKSGQYKKMGAILKQTDKVAILPLFSNRDEIFNFIYTFFGTSYRRFVRQLYFPKRFTYIKTLIKGSMVKKAINKGYVQQYIKTRLPEFPTVPQDKLINKKCTVFDYSDIISTVIPRTSETLKRPTFKAYSEYIYPEFMMKLIFPGSNNIYRDGFKLTKELEILSNGPKIENIFDFGFNRIIFPIKIESKSIKPFSLQYMNGSARFTNEMRTNPSIIYEAGLIRFIYNIITNSYVDGDNASYINNWIRFFQDNNPIFFFYNSTLGFTLDIKELKFNLGWKTVRIAKRLRELITVLIRSNLNEIPEDELEQIIIDSEKDQEQDEETKKENKQIAPIELNKMQKASARFTNLINDIIESAKIKTNKTSFNKFKNLTETDDVLLNEKIEKLINPFSDSDAKLEEDLFDEENLPEFDPSLQNEAGISSSTDNDEQDDEIEPEEEKEVDEEDLELEEALHDLEVEESEKENEEFDDKLEEFEIEEEANSGMKEILNDDEQKKFFESVRKSIKPLRSPKQIQRINLIKDKYKSIKVNDKETISDILEDIDKTKIDNIDFKVPMRDPSFKQVNVVDFERTYIDKTYEKDILNTLKAFSDDNKEIKLHMLDYKKEDSSDQFNAKETIRVRFEDEDHNVSTVKFDVPKIDKNFRMLVNGTTRLLKKQIIFLPVVKTSPNTVWLTTQYNKMYIERVDYMFNRSTYVLKELIFNQLKNNDNILLKLGSAKKHNKDLVSTVEYDELSDKLISLTLNPDKANKIEFNFHFEDLKKIIKEQLPDYKFKDNLLPIGFDYGNKQVINFSLINLKNRDDINEISVNDMTEDKKSVSGLILKYIKESNVLPEIDSIINSIKIPKRKSYSRIMLMSKKTPLILFLGYLWGLVNVIQAAKIPVEITTQPIRGDKRAVIRFKDAYLYYDYFPLSNALLLNGLNYIDTREINISDMNQQEPYLEWLYDEYQTRNISKGWADFKELCLDNITLEILRDQGLPTDLLELILYCNDLLGDNNYEHEADGDIEKIYRIRCHEVIPETIYKCLANQYKTLRKAKDPSKVSMSIPQDAVMAKLFKLTTFNNHDITNPLNELKQRGVVSFKGSTGINDSDAFSESKRAYGSKFPGIIALSAPDNAQVGITKQLTANPNIISTRGFLKTYKNPSDLVDATTSEMVSIEEAAYPFAMDHDDPKRLSYMTGQTTHTIKTIAAEPSIVQTSVDKIIANITSDDWAAKAKNSGKVLDIDDKYHKIYVEYDDGSKDCIDIGHNYKNNSSYYFDLKLEPNVKKGEKFEKGKVLAYEKDFFEKVGNDLIYKQGPIAFLCVNESDNSEEDSSFITEEFSGKLKTSIVMAKGVVLSPNTNLIKCCEIGEHVLAGDPLVLFEDAHDATNAQIIELLGDIDDETKADMMQKAPRSEYSGSIVDIKVYWTIPLEDMQPSLQEFVSNYIKKRKQEASSETKMTGKPSDKLLETEISKPHLGRIKKYLVPEEGGVVIEFFISHEQIMSTGDKTTNLTALKSIIADVVPQNEAPMTESGLVLDGNLSLLSISARMINSIWLVSFISKIMFDFKNEMVDYYFDDDKK